MLVILTHCLSAILEELVFWHRRFVWVGLYASCEFLVFALAPLLVCCLTQGWIAATQLLVPHEGEGWRLLRCGLLMTLSHGAGLAANLHVNYAAAVLFSAARLPLVLVVGACLHKDARTTPWAHGAALCTMLGLCIFGFAEKRDSPRFSTFGLVLITANLIFGSITFNYQQMVLQKPCQDGRRSSANQLMVIQYLTCASLCLCYSLASGELFDFLARCQRGAELSIWVSVAGQLAPVVLGSLLTSVGVRTLLLVNEEFDAARSSVITSSRKVCTFVLSFAVFPKPLSVMHVFGVVLTLLGSVEVHRALSAAPANESDGARGEQGATQGSEAITHSDERSGR